MSSWDSNICWESGGNHWPDLVVSLANFLIWSVCQSSEFHVRNDYALMHYMMDERCTNFSTQKQRIETTCLSHFACFLYEQFNPSFLAEITTKWNLHFCLDFLSIFIFKCALKFLSFWTIFFRIFQIMWCC